MAEKLMKLDVVTPQGVSLAQDNVEAVYVETISGSMGFLPDHTPLIAALKPHALRYSVAGTETPLFVSGGLVEVFNNEVHVVAPAAEGKSEIDFARAQAALDRALARLQSKENIDEARAKAALERAKARLSMRD